MSSDGRYVVFESEATNLVSSDTNAAQDIFVRDRSLGTTTRVSTNSSGTQANGFNAEPVISPDGRYVGFHSAATNLVANDSNDDWDIYVKDLSNGAIVRASLSSNENQTTERSANAWLSDQALHIAFESDATNLVSGDTNGVKDIFVRDRIATTTERASVSSSESQANQSSQWPSISSNGGYVAFESFATNLVSGDANGSRDVFLRDRSAGTTTRVSVSSSGQEANGPSTVGMVAGGGGHVVFDSDATNLISQDTNGVDDVFIRDLAEGTTSLVSVASGNRPPVVSFSVTPEQGDTNTTFTADMSGTYDPDGDSLTYEIDWGDGAVSAGIRATHQYSESGDYVVTGTATDSLGVASSSEVTVRVCDAFVNGECVQRTNGVPDPCYDTVVSCELPVSTEPPEEADPVIGVASYAAATAQDAVRRVYSPNGEIVVVSANVKQIYATVDEACSNTSRDSCNQSGRERAFARRISALAAGGSEMGVPDVILLQEAAHIHPKFNVDWSKPNEARDGNDDIGGIRNRLNAFEGFEWRIGRSRRAGPNIPDDGSTVASHCEQAHANSADRTKCRNRIRVEADSAILYNSLTVQRVGSDVQDFVDNKYGENEARDCPNGQVPDSPLVDVDLDRRDDCEITWRRQFMAHFQELALDDNGLPTTETTDLDVAVATVHFVTPSRLRKDNPNTDDEDESSTTHNQLKTRWSNRVVDVLQSRYASADAWIVGGDFNIHRCANKANGDERDYPSGAQACSPRPWWTSLTAPTPATPVLPPLPSPLPTPTPSPTESPGKGYRDAVYHVHKDDNREEAESDRLRLQYKNGCTTLDPAPSTECTTANADFSVKRIDFLFGRGLDTLDSSHDTTCGQVRNANFDPSCKDKFNSQRYSDHRLVWVRLGST